MLSTAIVMGIFVLIIAVGIGAFFLKREKIRTWILTELNQAQQGEIYIHQIHFTPFEFLPYFTISLDSVSYFEHKAEARLPDEQPIITVSTLITGVEYEDVFKGIFKPAALILEHGKIRLITYTDSSLNLLNAVGVHQAGPPKEDSEQPEAVFGVTKEGPLGCAGLVFISDPPIYGRIRSWFLGSASRRCMSSREFALTSPSSNKKVCA